MEILFPDSTRLILDSCRRLTGPSLVWEEPGAILDVLIDGIEMESVLECWYRQVNALLSELAWDSPKLAHRRFENGFNLLLAAPVDQLFTAVMILETAWYLSACELLDVAVESRDLLLGDIREQSEMEASPKLNRLEVEALAHGVDILIDEDIVSIGHGVGCASFAIDQIPDTTSIDWSQVHNIPVALVTGTNGKSTSVRLLDSIARAANQTAGVTSTDFVRVGDDILDQGDYSGPGGARLLLRDPRVEAGFLEVARGGILRRGLAVRHARAALITNVANDHLGQYGVNSLAALTATKFVVSKALTKDGVLVVNADDPEIVRYLESRSVAELCWFSLHESNPLIKRQLEQGGRCCYSDGEHLFAFDGDRDGDRYGAQQVCRIEDIPMTFSGAALHNVHNALGAIGVAQAMNYSAGQIRDGLRRFNSDERDNPGRLNSFELVSGARAIVDFAHNAHSVAAVVSTVARITAGQKWALFSSAGDRSDDEITAIASGLCTLQPDQVVIAEIEHYLRGRALGEVSAILKQACLDNGLAEHQIHLVDSPLSGVALALSRMQAGDLGLFLVLSERSAVIDYLRQH